MDFRSQINENYINPMVSMEPMVTTISISHDMKEKLKNLGRTGESYEDVIRRMYEYTRKNLLRDMIYDKTDTLTLDEARRRLNNG